MQYSENGNGRRLGILAGACLAAIAMTTPKTSAAERTWKSANGLFGLGLSWAEGVAPGPNDTALFNNGSNPYAVQFSLGDATTSQLAVLNANPQFLLSGKTYTVTDSAFVGYNPGDLGRLALVGSGTLSADLMVLGEFDRSSGAVTLDSSALLKANTLFVGASGEGSLTVKAGTRVDAGILSTGSNSDGAGTISVSGGATVVADDIRVGSAGIGNMTVSGGSLVSFGAGLQPSTTIASGPSASGVLVVTGAGTEWITGGLTVAGSGRGELDIEGGAVVDAGDLLVAAQGGARGTVTISGSGSTLNLAGTTFSSNGLGVVNIEPGAILNATHSGEAYVLANTNLNGGTFNVYGLATPIHFNSGTLRVTNPKGLAIGGGALGQSSVPADFAVPAGGTFQISGPLTVSVDRRLSLNGQGSIEIGAIATDISNNAGTIDVTRGQFLAHNTFVNQAGAAFSVVGSDSITFSGGLQNAGNVTLAAAGISGTIANAASGNIYIADTATFAGKVTNDGTIAAGGSVTFNGGLTNNGTINVTGTQSVASPAAASFLVPTGVDGKGSLTIGPGAVALTSHIAQDALHVTDGGSLYLSSAAPSPSVVKSLQLDAGGKIDLTNNALVVDYTPGASPLAAIRAAVLAKSITSSLLNDRTAIGYADATDVPAPSRGAAPDDSSIIVRYTLSGDADLNGAVDFNDLVRLAQNYNAHVATTTDAWWSHGDFTGDGITDFNDLVKLAQNYNDALPAGAAIPGAAPQFEADLSRAAASVPEPGMLGIFSGIAVASLARRRRQR